MAWEPDPSRGWSSLQQDASGNRFWQTTYGTFDLNGNPLSGGGGAAAAQTPAPSAGNGVGAGVPGPTSPGSPYQGGQIDDTLLRFLMKYGISPGGNQAGIGQSIFDLPGTTQDPSRATQRGIWG